MTTVDDLAALEGHLGRVAGRVSEREGAESGRAQTTAGETRFARYADGVPGCTGVALGEAMRPSGRRGDGDRP